MNTKALHKLSYGVYAVTTSDEPFAGCIANSAMQISSKPATIAVSINKNNFTHDAILKNGRFAISVLSEQTNPQIIGTFGFQSTRTVNKFSQVAYQLKQGLPVLSSACAWFTLELQQQIDAGTHTIFLGQVSDCDIYSEETPMTYAYYHSVLKGKSPKAAPTYVEGSEFSVSDTITTTTTTEKNRYVCTICGYIHEAESLEADFVCPICKQPSSVFKKI